MPLAFSMANTTSPVIRGSAAGPRACPGSGGLRLQPGCQQAGHRCNPRPQTALFQTSPTHGENRGSSSLATPSGFTRSDAESALPALDHVISQGCPADTRADGPVFQWRPGRLRQGAVIVRARDRRTSQAWHGLQRCARDSDRHVGACLWRGLCPREGAADVGRLG
jgi:hypothetical protein